MHHIAHCTPCIALLLVSYTCALALDPVEHGPEESQEPAQAVEPNTKQEQGKPRCIPPIILGFSFNIYNYVLLDCAFKFIGIE
jgi:hypothetical protein